MKEKKDRVDDALHATRAAVEEGIIPGGGIAFMNSYVNYENKKEEKLKQLENEDQKLGYKIVYEAIKEPFMSIMYNTGENGEAIWQKVQAARGKVKTTNVSNLGIDARTQDIVDMVDAGIIDPVKVTRISLEKAASVAITFLITNCVIIVDKEEDKNNSQSQNMLGMM